MTTLRKMVVMAGLAGGLLTLWQRPLFAEVITQEIKYSHEGLDLSGYLAWDNALAGKRPGVLLVHEWWGLNDYARTRARQLAGMGYIAFALDMYGGGRVTHHPDEAGQWAQQVRANAVVWRARARAGLDELLKQDLVDPDRVAAIGYCFGGSTVLHMAYTDAPLKGVVSFHGALVPPAADTTVKPRVLICHGGADAFIPQASVDAFQSGMEQVGAKYTIVTFGGVRHSFTNPDAGTYGIENIKYDADADRQSWTLMKLFFDDLFATQQAPPR